MTIVFQGKAWNFEPAALLAVLHRRRQQRAGRAVAEQLSPQLLADIGLSDTGELLAAQDRDPGNRSRVRK